MKKVLYSFLCVILALSFVLTSCGKTGEPGKAQITDFGKIKNSFWIANETYGDVGHYKLCVFTDDSVMLYDMSYDAGESLTDMFVRMLSGVKKKNPDLQFDDFQSFITADVSVDGLKSYLYLITVNPDEGQIIAGNQDLVFNYQSNGSIKCHGDTYAPRDSFVHQLENAFLSAKESISSSEKEAFLAKYADAVTNREVQYDPIGNLNKSFIISGKASLDDYYNYEYRNFSAVYYCIEITPKGGGYTDRWYIYANREKFSELYKALLESGKTLTLICEAKYYNASQNRLASLVDYYID